MISLCIFMCISCVSASDNTNSSMTAGSDIPVDNMTVPGSYDDLKGDIQNIHSGEVYNFTRDYRFDGDGQIIILKERIIPIVQDNIVINGNGHTIDAGGSKNFAVFRISGNNVTIANLTFANSEPGSLQVPKINPSFLIGHEGHDAYRYDRINSPVCWQGNNGVMKDCSFYNNRAVNGGAMAWTGSDGKIDNCIFINNTARGVGGALCIGGVNNLVSNCVFINSRSLLSEEAIYLNRNRENITFASFVYTNQIPVIDGAVLNIDEDYLFYSYDIYAYGNLSTSEGYKLDVVPLLYKAIVNGGVNDIGDIKLRTTIESGNCVINGIVNDVGDNIKYYAQHFNETRVFAFNIAAYEEFTSWDNRRVGSEYLKSLYFSNITDFNQVFDYLIHGNYTVGITQTQIIYVSNLRDYIVARDCYAFGLWFDGDKGAENFVNNLKVVFTDKLTLNCDYTWNPHNMGYTSVIIMGNGSTIKGGAKDRDEKKWVQIDEKATFIATDLVIKNFNTAVECLAGICFFDNVQFDNNRMDYIIDRDWGAAILNTGYVACENCRFTNNYAKNGGAIFNQGILELNNITFANNKAYGVGNDVCVGDGGIVRINGVNITKESSKNLNAIAGINLDGNMTYLMPHLYFAESMSAGTSAIVSALAVATATIAGLAAGTCFANPFVGAAVGFGVGALIGAGLSAAIISQHYDVNYSRLKTILTTTIECAIAGAIGGYIGSCNMGLEITSKIDSSYVYNEWAIFPFELSVVLVFGGIGGLSGYLIND